MSEPRQVELLAPGCRVDGRRFGVKGEFLVKGDTLRMRFRNRPDAIFTPTGRVTEDGYEVWAEQ